jgi:arylsulfatase A-like enzyme
VNLRRIAGGLLCCAAAALLAADCGGAGARPPSVLLIVVDTLRADHLSMYGYGRDTSPRLSAFAQGAAVLERVGSPRAKTTPAVASLMTGLYPHEHGVRDLAQPLPAGVPVLAESFARAGYRTAAIVGNYVLTDARSGLARGFRLWVEDLPDRQGVPPDDVPQRRASSLTDGALVALGLAPPSQGGAGPHLAAGGPDDPFFLYLHYMDPHGAYDPPAEHRVFAAGPPEPIPAAGDLPPHPFQELRVADYNAPAETRLPDGTIDAARVRALYDGEIRFADAEIGRLLAALEAAGRLANTLVIVTADHGESLGEHRYFFEHGFYAYETTQRVPLLVRGPGVVPRRIDADMSLADLAPTLLELCGLPPLPAPPGSDPDGPRGRSQAALLRGAAAPAPHAVFSEKIERQDLAGTVQIKAVRLGPWKLIRRYTHAAAGGPERAAIVLSEELYDLGADPGEQLNLAAAPPAAAPLDRLRAELVRFAASDVRFADLAAELQRRREELEREDPEAARILRSLGY